MTMFTPKYSISRKPPCTIDTTGFSDFSEENSCQKCFKLKQELEDFKSVKAKVLDRFDSTIEIVNKMKLKLDEKTKDLSDLGNDKLALIQKSEELRLENAKLKRESQVHHTGVLSRNDGRNDGRNYGQNGGQNSGQSGGQNDGKTDGQNDSQNDSQNDQDNGLEENCKNFMYVRSSKKDPSEETPILEISNSKVTSEDEYSENDLDQITDSKPTIDLINLDSDSDLEIVEIKPASKKIDKISLLKPKIEPGTDSPDTKPRSSHPSLEDGEIEECPDCKKTEARVKVMTQKMDRYSAFKN